MTDASQCTRLIAAYPATVQVVVEARGPTLDSVIEQLIAKAPSPPTEAAEDLY